MMMSKLREFSKIFIIIIAVSFIGLMVFQWGMNYSGKQKGNNKVGTVNGHDLTYPVFSDMYQQMYQEERARSGKENFSDEDLQRLRNQVWERFIQRILFKEQMEKLGITVSDSEIVYQIYNYPLQDFKKHPAFQTNGIFDINKYHAAFGNPNIPWMQVEQIYREQIPYLKLQQVITSTANVSDEEVKDEFIRTNLKAKAEYLEVAARRFEKGITASDAEIEAYYNAHKEDFKQNEKRKLSYVMFPIQTTKEDTARILKEFNGIRERLASGEKFSDLADEYSEDPSVKTNHGDLGYFERGAMVKAFSDAAFSAKKGEVVGPVQTAYGLHLIKVEDRKKENGKWKVKASHILMKVTPAPSRVEEIENSARYFSEDAKDNGFDKQAKTLKYDVKQTNFFEETGSFIPGIGNNLAIMNFAFSGKLNDVSGVYRLDDKGFVVVSVSAIQPAGYKSLESQKRIITNRIKFEKAKAKAKAFAVKIGEKVKKGVPFTQIAAEDTSHATIARTTPEFTMAGTIPGIGRSPEFAGAAFALEPGQTSNLVEADRGFFYIKLLSKTTFDSSAFNQQKAALQSRLLNTKRNRIFQKWYEDLKANADIVDNRKQFNL